MTMTVTEEDTCRKTVYNKRDPILRELKMHSLRFNDKLLKQEREKEMKEILLSLSFLMLNLLTKNSNSN